MAASMQRYVCTVEYTTATGKHRSYYSTVIEAENMGVALEAVRRQCQRRRNPLRIISATARLETKS